MINKLEDCNSVEDLVKLIGEDEITEEEYQDMVSFVQDKISGNTTDNHSNSVEG
jgi:hypothetical protein